MSTISNPPTRLGEILAGIAAFQDKKVLVVGDFFLDEYVEGEMFDISKEGPIPVIRLESKIQTAGAAGNLASSIRQLGAQVKVVGVIGEDLNGQTLVEKLEKNGVDCRLLIRDDKPTLSYTKIRARVESSPSTEVLRLDVLPSGPLPAALEDRLIKSCEQAGSDTAGIIVLDQIRHVITRRFLDALPKIANSRNIFLHGSSREHIGDFHDFDLIIPNDVEARNALGHGSTERLTLEDLGEELKKKGRHRQALVTLGPEGMALFPRDEPMQKIPTFARDVVDVTGAGDAVASTAILGNLLGWHLTTVAWMASQSAAIAVAKVGTHHVTREELEDAVRRGYTEGLS